MKLILYTVFFLLMAKTYAQPYEVIVKNLKGEITHIGEFATSLEAEKWILEHETEGNWGKSERVILKSLATEEELASEVIEEYPEEYEGFNENGLPRVKLPARVKLRKTFSVLVTDVSEQKKAEKQKEQRIRDAREKLRGLKREDFEGLTDKQVIKKLVDIVMDLAEKDK